VDSEADETQSDTDLIADFMRIRNSGATVILEVATVRWSGPHTPRLKWTKYRSWGSVKRAEVFEAQKDALNDSRFFGVCARCHMKFNRGHMPSDDTCMGCAERDLGMIH